MRPVLPVQQVAPGRRGLSAQVGHCRWGGAGTGSGGSVLPVASGRCGFGQRLPSGGGVTRRFA